MVHQEVPLRPLSNTVFQSLSRRVDSDFGLAMVNLDLYASLPYSGTPHMLYLQQLNPERFPQKLLESTPEKEPKSIRRRKSG